MLRTVSQTAVFAAFCLALTAPAVVQAQETPPSASNQRPATGNPSSPLPAQVADAFAREKWAEAEPLLRAALKDAPKSALLHDALGRTLLELGRMAEAQGSARRAADLEPANADYQVRAAGLFFQAKKYELAETYIRKAVNDAPKRADLWRRGAAVLLARGKRADAERFLQATIQLDPKDAASHDALGGLLLRRGEWGGAEAQFRAAVHAAPGVAAYYDHLGGALVEGSSGKDNKRPKAQRVQAFKDAQVVLGKAIALDPKEPIYHADLAVVLLGLGQTKAARESVARAMDMGLKDHPVYRSSQLLPKVE